MFCRILDPQAVDSCLGNREKVSNLGAFLVNPCYMNFYIAGLVRSFTMLKGIVNLSWRFGSSQVRNEVCSVSQTCLNIEYCFRDSCAIRHVRKWWYVPQKYAGVQSNGRAEKEDFISHRRSKFEWILLER